MMAARTALLLLSLLGSQDGEVQIEADLNRTVARVGETILLTVSVRAPGIYSPEIEDPQFDGFELLATSDRSTFRFTTAVGALREFTREYILRVEQPGRLTIPPVSISIDDVLYETEALQLNVEEDSGALIPDRLTPRAEEEVAVRLWVEPDTVYVGQQVTLNVAALFDPLVRNRLQRQPEYRPPDVRGFWTADLPGTSRPERQVLDRREYFVQTYRRALFPLGAGKYRIPPAAVIYEVRRGLIYAPETFEVESSPATVVVRALPVEGRPEDFAGAVGRYETEIWFDRSDLRAGEAVNLVLQVEGSGNLNALARPHLPDIPGVRVYEGGEDAEVRLRGAEFAGHKRFSWVLVPERPGQYVLPALRFPYFDPDQATYRVARTETVSLLVESAASAELTADAPRGVAIRFIRDRLGDQPSDLHRRPLFWAIQLLPVLLLIALFGAGRYRVRRAAGPASPSPQRKDRALRDLRGFADSGDPVFFSRLRAAVLAWLAARLATPDLAGRGLAQVQHALEDAGVPPDVTLEVIDLLEACARARYAPEPPGRSVFRDFLTRADGLLARVDREAISERKLRGVARSGTALLLLTLTCAVELVGAPQAAPKSVSQWFEDGVAAYSRGDYERAVEMFERVLDVRPRDPNILYNLGNAYYELDARGKAVAFWVRALRVRPRDGHARHNLRAAIGDDPVVGSALPPLPLSVGELTLLFSVLWLGGLVALLARARWRNAYLTLVGSGSLVLSLLCALLIFLPRGRYAIVTGPDSVVRAGPVHRSEIVSAPSAGAGYLVREVRGDWVQVTRGGEREGWIEREGVELIE